MAEKMLSQVGLTIIGLFLAIGLGYCLVTLIIWIIHSFHRGNYVPVGILAAGLIALVYQNIRARHRHPVR
jgi:hypothetical protein